MQKQVMTKAVRIAKTFEGEWVARMKMALKMAWVIVKKSATNTLKTIENWKQELVDAFEEEALFVKVNTWEKYGKRRLYINVGFDGIGYVEVDEHSNYVKSWVDRSFFQYGNRWEEQGRAIDQFSIIKELLDGGNW